MRSTYFPAIFFICLSVAGFSCAQLKPDENSTQLAIVYPPNQKFEENFMDAVKSGARVVRAGTLPNILIVQSSNKNTYSDLKNSSAVVVLNALVEGGCVLKYKDI